jgi:hypothetical protein
MIKSLNNLCKPALFYLVISVIGLILLGIQNSNPDPRFCIGRYECNQVTKFNGFMIQVIYILFWTWLLNILCKNKLKNLSWFVVLFPLIMYVLGIMGLVSNGFLYVKEGFPHNQHIKKTDKIKHYKHHHGVEAGAPENALNMHPGGEYITVLGQHNKERRHPNLPGMDDWINKNEFNKGAHARWHR